jgi:hypothetical protein
VGLGQSTRKGTISVATPTRQFEYPVTEWFTGEYAAIPERMREGLKRYVIDGLIPGDFLTAIIQNNLRNAVGYADDENLPLLPLYVRWFYNRPPSVSHGSPEAFVEWLDELAEVRNAIENMLGAGPAADAIVESVRVAKAATVANS